MGSAEKRGCFRAAIRPRRRCQQMALSGSRLTYVVYVNNVAPAEGIGDVIEAFADEGEISDPWGSGFKSGIGALRL